VRRALLPIAIGCVLVGVVAGVVAIVGWNWGWFALANAALAVLLLTLFRGTISGADERRPSGRARVSAARWAGPPDPGILAAQEADLEPDPEVAVAARAGDVATAFAFMWTAAAPAAAAVLAVVFRL
jgi:hypothetical protein